MRDTCTSTENSARSKKMKARWSDRKCLGRREGTDSFRVGLSGEMFAVQIEEVFPRGRQTRLLVELHRRSPWLKQQEMGEPGTYPGHVGCDLELAFHSACKRKALWR